MKLVAFFVAVTVLVCTCQNNAKQVEQPAQKATNDTLPIPAKKEEALPVYDYDTTQWLEVVQLEPSVIVDIKYASSDNFVGEQIYDCGRCFLRPKAAKAIAKIQQELQQQNLSLRLFDCYRPSPMQWRLWNKVPDRRYVADPRKGSMHSRGLAVDLTITDSLGNDWPMGSPYDFFGRAAHTTHRDFPDSILHNRDFFQALMIKHGFQPIRSEWWHFSMKGAQYPLDAMVWNCD